jgi:hypothetical protein
MTKTIFVAVVLLASITGAAQGDDKKIAGIREIYESTNRRIANAEKNFAESEIFLTELVVNGGGTMYPAVGHFKETVRFYYTYGSREVSPYPNRILKINVSTERSAASESADYFFSPAGQLVFVFESDGQIETRFYFAGDKLIRWQKGSKVMSLSQRGASAAVRDVIKEKERLMMVFRASID